MDKSILLGSVIANALSEDDLVDMLQKAIDKYNAKRADNVERRHEFNMICCASALLSMKHLGDPIEVSKNFDAHMNVYNMLHPDKQ